VKANHATAAEVERLPMDEDDAPDEDEDEDEESSPDDGGGSSTNSGRPEQLGSRDNFWGG